MTKTISISDATFERLKAIAEPLVDTEDSVISRLLDQNSNSEPAVSGAALAEPELALDPDAPDDLHHTRVLRAVFADEPVSPKWNELTKFAHRIAIEQLGLDRTIAVSKAKLERGRLEERGFKPLYDLDVSIQGLDAPRSWDSSLWLARELKTSIEVLFEWHNKPESARPGRRAKLMWSPTS